MKRDAIGLWGHSMGAVAAMQYAVHDPLVAGIVLDSPFADLDATIAHGMANECGRCGQLCSAGTSLLATLRFLGLRTNWLIVAMFYSK